MKDKAALADTLVLEKRNEAIRLYNLSVDNKTDESVLSLINKADSKELDGLLSQYSKNAIQQFSGTCKSCGGSEIQFRSSNGDNSDGKDGKDSTEALSFEDIMDKYDSKSMNILKK